MKYIFLDTETTGLPDWKKPADAPGQPRVCQIGLIFVNDDLEIEREIEHLIRPNGWTFDDHSEAAKINGFTHQQLMDDGVDIKDLLREYGSAIDERRIVAGHNCSFDMKMMRAELRIAGYPDRYMQTRSLCTMYGSRDAVGIPLKSGRGFKLPKLVEACQHFGIEQPSAHSALADAHSALGILRKLRDMGTMPAYLDPYDDRPKAAIPKKALRQALPPDAEQEIPDFIGGASEDGK